MDRCNKKCFYYFVIKVLYMFLFCTLYVFLLSFFSIRKRTHTHQHTRAHTNARTPSPSHTRKIFSQLKWTNMYNIWNTRQFFCNQGQSEIGQSNGQNLLISSTTMAQFWGCEGGWYSCHCSYFASRKTISK